MRPPVALTLYTLAAPLIHDITEREGAATHPAIAWFHEQTIGKGIADEISWCSSFCAWLAKMCRLSRSKSPAARSWLKIGVPLTFEHHVASGWNTEARAGENDIVILKRGTTHGPEAGDGVGGFAKGQYPPGHVGIFMGFEGDRVHVLGGNQSNGVTLTTFPAADVIGLRRLTP